MIPIALTILMLVAIDDENLPENVTKQKFKLIMKTEIFHFIEFVNGFSINGNFKF